MHQLRIYQRGLRQTPRLSVFSMEMIILGHKHIMKLGLEDFSYCQSQLSILLHLLVLSTCPFCSASDSFTVLFLAFSPFNVFKIPVYVFGSSFLHKQQQHFRKRG